MAYVRTHWVNNPPSDRTPVDAYRMNNIESGIEEALELETRIEKNESELEDFPNYVANFERIEDEINSSLPLIQSAYDYSVAASDAAGSAEASRNQMQSLLQDVTQAGFVLATDQQAGLMSAEDKAQLDNLLSDVQEELGYSAHVVIETSEGYGARIEGRTNVYVGSSNPSGEMSPQEDVWFNTSPSLDSDTLVNTINDPSSSIGSAIRAASNEKITLPAPLFSPGDRRSPISNAWSSNSASSYTPPVWYFEKDTQLVSTVVDIPENWNSARLMLYWSHKEQADTGSVMWNAYVKNFDVGALLSGTTGTNFESVIDSVSGGRNRVLRSDFPNVIGNDNRGPVVLTIARVGTNAEDTFESFAALMYVVLERTS